MMDVEKLGQLPAHLATRVKGQAEAVRITAAAVQRGQLGVHRSTRPRGSLLFLGPTGTGKTQLALETVMYLAGTDDPKKISEIFARFDMAEYQTQDSIGRLIGSHKGEQGLFGDASDRIHNSGHGFGFLLFDEVEKAHPDLTTVFLAAMDAGRMTMSNGLTKDLTPCYLVFTSNLGSAEAAQMQASSGERVKRHILSVAQNTFRPELYARFDERIVFEKLTYETQIDIARGMLLQEIDLICSQKKVHLSVGGTVLAYLVKKGFDRILGARPMRSAVEREIGNAWTGFLLLRSANGEGVREGEKLTLVVDRDALTIQ